MNLHLISYEEDKKSKIIFKNKKINVSVPYRYLEETHAARNNIHIEVWNSLQETSLITENLSNLNEGVIEYSILAEKYLNTFCKDWQVLFLDCRSYDFWYSQRKIERPIFSNNWGGFGSFLSSFMLKRIMEGTQYRHYELNCPLDFSLYLVNKKNINKAISMLENSNLIENSIERIFYRNMHLFNIYIANPKINLAGSFASSIQKEADACFRFAFPMREDNVYKLPIIDTDYQFEFEINEDLISSIPFSTLEKMLIFKLNTVRIPSPKLITWIWEDPENNFQIRKIKFNMSDILKTKIKIFSGYVSERNTLEISLSVNGEKFCGKTFFSLKNVDKKNK